MADETSEVPEDVRKALQVIASYVDTENIIGYNIDRVFRELDTEIASRIEFIVDFIRKYYYGLYSPPCSLKPSSSRIVSGRNVNYPYFKLSRRTVMTDYSIGRLIGSFEILYTNTYTSWLDDEFYDYSNEQAAIKRRMVPLDPSIFISPTAHTEITHCAKDHLDTVKLKPMTWNLISKRIDILGIVADWTYSFKGSLIHETEE